MEKEIALGTVRVTDIFNSPAGLAQSLVVNNRGDLSVNQALPERAELVRMGRSYAAQIATANAFTYVAGFPTTRAELVVYNNASSGGVSLLIDHVWMYGVTSMGAAQPITLVGQLTAAGAVAAPTDGTTTIVQTSLSGKTVGLTRAGVALFALANTAFAVANHWQVLGTSLVPAPTTNLGASVEAFCYGRYIVPPGASFCLAGIAGTAAGTAIIGVEYHEVQLALG